MAHARRRGCSNATRIFIHFGRNMIARMLTDVANLVHCSSVSAVCLKVGSSSMVIRMRELLTESTHLGGDDIGSNPDERRAGRTCLGWNWCACWNIERVWVTVRFLARGWRRSILVGSWAGVNRWIVGYISGCQRVLLLWRA